MILRKLRKHLSDFPYIWIVIILLAMAALLTLCTDFWGISRVIGYCALGLLLVLLLTKPMNAVYGLMGTTGDIQTFFFNFIFITFLFAVIYHFEFFSNAGISYDVNQPHIDYQMFAHSNSEDSLKIENSKDTIFLEHIIDSVTYKEAVVVPAYAVHLHYQKINFFDVWKCTILTTLTQEPTNLLAYATTFNAGMDDADVNLDRQKSDIFHWILIFHIIISWIFFGVFISLLYNKFRYES